MLAIPSRRSAHRSVPDAGTLTIINQIPSILSIHVKLPRSPFKWVRVRSARHLSPRRRHGKLAHPRPWAGHPTLETRIE